MNNKKVVFFLLVLVVATGLITFILNKSKQIEKIQKSNNENQVTLNGKVYPILKEGAKDLINAQEDQSLKDLMKNYDQCHISLGMPLGLNQIEPGIFQVTELSPMSIHQELNLKVGDKILGSGFLASKKDEPEKELTILRNDLEILKIKYKVSIILNCF